jgi:hypothetical protein
MRKLLLIWLLLFSNFAIGQIESKLSDSLYHIADIAQRDSSKYDTLLAMFNDIELSIKHKSNIIKVKNRFISMNRVLFVDYYLKNKNLFYVEVSQVCPTNFDLTCKARYYIGADSIIQDEYFSQRKASICVSYSFDEISKLQSCPEKFDRVFLRDYIIKLFLRVRSIIFKH